ncbi:MAG: hypothetical protein KC708_03145 [Anaerolineae bacterium]|nr:hypothetical protein [Anaerolineae bacterium]
MAQRKRGKFGLRGFIILVLVTVISGFALKATGNLISPFEYSVMLLNTPALEDDGGFQMVSLDADATTDETGTVQEFTPLENMGEMEAMTYSLADYLNFAWDDFGNVLYNLWVMAILTIIVIVAARPIGWLVKRYKQATKSQTNRYAAQH